MLDPTQYVVSPQVGETDEQRDHDWCRRCFYDLPWSHEIENEPDNSEQDIEECRICGSLRLTTILGTKGGD